jgi:uncharacterized protein YcbK (DUF882 family)
MKKPKHFKLHELVSKQVFKKYGERAWTFFDPRLVETLDFIREKLDKPITVNNWISGGPLEQRGFRCNMDPLPLKKTKSGIIYCSAHMCGQAVDFDVKGMTAQKVRDWIIQNQDSLPYPIRLEDGVSWVHLDVRQANQKVYLFKV